MKNIILNFVSGILHFCIFLTFFICFLGSWMVIYNNIKYFEVYKRGVIIEIDYTTGSRSDGLKGTFSNVMLTDLEKDTVRAGTQEMYDVGDKVKFRFAGNDNCTIFEVNGETIGSGYLILDWLSPFLLLFSGFAIYKILAMWRRELIKHFKI